MDSNYKLWGGVTVGILVVVLGLMWLVGNTPTPAPGTGINAPAVTADDWQTGPAGAPLTLIEYSDFECPACAAYQPIVKQLRADYGDQLNFIYRHFPLPQHSKAKITSYAAEAAGLQGRFFEMQDMLFEGQADWVSESDVMPILVSYAEQLGLDISRFEIDIESDAVKKRVADDEAESRRLGIPATPTFFLNGEQLQSPAGYDGFKALFDAIL